MKTSYFFSCILLSSIFVNFFAQSAFEDCTVQMNPSFSGTGCFSSGKELVVVQKVDLEGVKLKINVKKFDLMQVINDVEVLVKKRPYLFALGGIVGLYAIIHGIIVCLSCKAEEDEKRSIWCDDAFLEELCLGDY